MKRILGLLLGLGCGAFAHADSLSRICDNLFNSYDQSECRQIIRGGYFEEDAVAICADMFSSSNTLECLQTIRDGFYESNVTSVCRAMFSESNAIECLDIARDHYYVPQIVPFCHSLFSEYDQNRCLEIAANANFQPEAIDVCESLFSQNLECERAIADMSFDYYDLDSCQNEWLDSNIVECLRDTGFYDPLPNYGDDGDALCNEAVEDCSSSDDYYGDDSEDATCNSLVEDCDNNNGDDYYDDGYGDDESYDDTYGAAAGSTELTSFTSGGPRCSVGTPVSSAFFNALMVVMLAGLVAVRRRA